MLLVAAVFLAIAGAMVWGAVKLFRKGTPGMCFVGKLVGLGAFFVFMLSLACVVLSFGVDFR
jgi:hypothetical protein